MPALKREKLADEDMDLGAADVDVAEEICELSAMLADHRADENPAKKARQGSAQAKVASYHLLRAYDHLLKLVGVGGLAVFQSDPLEFSRILSPGEVRYSVRADPWDTYDVNGGGWLRFAIKDTISSE